MRLDTRSLLYAGAVQQRRLPAGAMLETCGWAGVYTPVPQSATPARGRYVVARARCSRVSASRDRRAGPVLSAGRATRVWSYARR